MERKFTDQAKRLTSITALLLMGVLFILRSRYCESVYPYADKLRAEWDGSDIFTMNVYAALFLLAFTLPWYYLRTVLSAILLDILISASITDVVDRFIFRINNKTEYDLIILILAILIITIEQIYASRKNAKLVKP